MNWTALHGSCAIISLVLGGSVLASGHWAGLIPTLSCFGSVYCFIDGLLGKKKEYGAISREEYEDAFRARLG